MRRRVTEARRGRLVEDSDDDVSLERHRGSEGLLLDEEEDDVDFLDDRLRGSDANLLGNGTVIRSEDEEEDLADGTDATSSASAETLLLLQSRKKLQDMCGTRTLFRGVFERYGSKSYKGHKSTTFLLKDVTCVVSGESVSDHLWFTVGKRISRLGRKLRRGDVLRFEARVMSYEKGRKRWRKGVKVRKRSWKLKFASKWALMSSDDSQATVLRRAKDVVAKKKKRATTINPSGGTIVGKKRRRRNSKKSNDPVLPMRARRHLPTGPPPKKRRKIRGLGGEDVRRIRRGGRTTTTMTSRRPPRPSAPLPSHQQQHPRRRMTGPPEERIIRADSGISLNEHARRRRHPSSRMRSAIAGVPIKKVAHRQDAVVPVPVASRRRTRSRRGRTLSIRAPPGGGKRRSRGRKRL